MSRVFTRTRTRTQTFTRAELIVVQVDRVLTRQRLPERYVDKILKGIRRRLIAEISIYGLDVHDACYAELFMRIDWARNQFHLAAGRDKVTIDSRWHDNLSIEADKSMELFEAFCHEFSLAVSCHARYAPGVDRDVANRELGFVRAEPVRWAGGLVGTAMSVPELDEFAVGVHFVDP